MPRHVPQPLPRAFAGHSDPLSRRNGMMNDDGLWERMDRCQVLGTGSQGHRGCVNAVSWSDDGSILLSGSDDKRICIWSSDASASSSHSPHPLKLQDTIATGHGANIFSAKFLPNASTPTIVSCAGDRNIRVFEVDRLGRAETGMRMGVSDELWGYDGPGVRVLRCHTDRTKRIATENSPSLFLTVSEDGTVRQHDLRRPHECRSECPEPLFRAPRGVDLYSLSVSTVTPHMFAVAGRTDCAYVCDRRMTERQNPSWGNNIKSSGQVHCVRQLGLPDEEWDSVMPRSRGIFAQERHITCVKMSPDNADEVICAFAQHSASLFSIYDSPFSESMRHRSSSPKALSDYNPKRSSSSPRPKATTPKKSTLKRANTDEDRQWYTAEDFERSPKLGKRRQSQLSSVQSNSAAPLRPRLEEGDGMGSEGTGGEQPVASPSTPPRDTYPNGESSQVQDLVNEIVRDAQIRGDVPTPGVGDGVGEEVEETVIDVDLDERPDLEMRAARRTLDGADDSTEDEPPNQTLCHGDDGTGPFPDPPLLDVDIDDLSQIQRVMEAADEGLSEGDDGDFGEEMDLDEFMEMEMDDDEDEDDEDMDDDDFGDTFDDDEEGLGGHLNAGPGEFASVSMLIPRKSFKGAKNIETVKDCNFLGARSEKVCSGSDDGNFFVWDKDSGKLEGIWEGDGHIVNVMEQHPTLPMVAVSGIDNTVKLFAPMSQPPTPSFARLHLRESIIKANTARRAFRPSSAFGSVSLLEFLASRGLTARVGLDGLDEEEGEEEAGPQQCQTQ